MTVWQLGKKQMEQDLSYLFNKETICNFHFVLKHDYWWWIKFRKNTMIGVIVSFVFCMIIGLIICLLQIWWDQSHPVTISTVYGFVAGGLIFWCCYAFILCIAFVAQAYYIHKALLEIFPYFKQAVKQGYLCSDETKYPEVVQMAFYADDPIKWRMYHPQSRFKYVMPLFGLVAILSQVKEYQSKYCPVNQDSKNNA